LEDDTAGGHAVNEIGASAAANMETAVGGYRDLILERLHQTLDDACASAAAAADVATPLEELRGQIEYHLGWRREDLSPTNEHNGKLLRPTLTLLACELAAGRAAAAGRAREQLTRRAALAGACVELVHDFSLVHDDIEDGDEMRRHRPTLWKLWGVPLAINTGDTILSIARLGLWRLIDEGVDADVVIRLAASLDRAVLELCEGQFLDLRFERSVEVTSAMYTMMIGRKTAALMSCCTEIGALLGAPGDRNLGSLLGEFGRALGVAFQLRDDLLGIWADEGALGKAAAGDIRRKKMTLPVICAMERATDRDRQQLAQIYAQDGPASDEQIRAALEILERAGALAATAGALWTQVAAARRALDAAAERAWAPADGGPRGHGAKAAREAYRRLDAILSFVASGVPPRPILQAV
jgi:geranylgeranyl diphosphate synthase type I